MKRRNFIIAGLLLAANKSVAVDDDYLKDLAFKKRMRFGSSVDNNIYRNSKYKNLVSKHCSIITPENQFKWKRVVRDNKYYDFEGSDRIYEWCKHNGMDIRGHALIFSKSMRDWFKSCSCDYEQELENYIKIMVSRYEGVISWDLFNEIVSSKGENGWLNKDEVFNAVGVNYVKQYTELMRVLSPNSELVVNEWIGPYDNRYFKSKRYSILRMLEFLKKQNIEIDTIGIQSHMLFLTESYSKREWQLFCKECKDLGFEIKITELDITTPEQKRIETRDVGLVKKRLRGYLEDTLEYSNVKDVIVWGMRDEYSYARKRESRFCDANNCSVFYDNGSYGLIGKELYDVLSICPVYKGRF